MTLDTIVCMDALEFLRGLPDESVDAVITDPPYGAKIAAWDMDVPPQEVLTECLRVSRGAVVWFGGRYPDDMLKTLHYQPIPDRILIWHVTFTISQTGHNGIYYRWHPIYCWRLTKQNTIQFDVIQCPQDGHNFWHHPGTKPLELITTLVEAFGGDIICDPFMGSGTTAVAARNLGRHFVGCDNSAEYVALANERLAQPYTPTLFDYAPEVQLSLFDRTES